MAQNDSLAKFLDAAVDAAKRAGEIIRNGFYQTKHVEHKGQVDLVTETDKACEDFIFNHLKQQFPTHKFIGEETTAACGVTELTDEPTWIVDPLDGTTNFVHGFPFVCVSIGLTIGKIPAVGVVYNPIMDELFTGIHGQGAFLNGKPIKVSSQTELVKSLLATEIENPNDPHVIEIGQFAVAEYNKQSKEGLKFESVEKGETQVVSDTNYRLILLANDGKVINKFEAIVWEKPWEHFKNLTSFKPAK